MPFDGRAQRDKDGRSAITFERYQLSGIDLARFWPEKSPKNMKLVGGCGRRPPSVWYIYLCPQETMVRWQALENCVFHAPVSFALYLGQ
jgi:hypothetical protein